MAWFGIVTPESGWAESVCGVVVAAEPEPSSLGTAGVVPVSVGGVVSSGTVGVSSPGTVGVVALPPPPDDDGLRVEAARWAGVAAPEDEAVEVVEDVVAPPPCAWWPCGEKWWPRSFTLGAGSRAAVVTAAGEGAEAASGWGAFLPDLTSRTTARVTTAPVTKQSRLRRITTFFATIVTPQR